tara:strand:+ start:361 stop:1383 length:1023 start_codon:yes stop_codon:yes gene_type:complete
MKSKKNITLADIAKTLDVSKVTVSKALRNHPDISKPKKDLVRKTALELGYIPNFMARNLSSKKSYTIGLVVPKVNGDFFPDIINQIYKSASDFGYEVILAVSQEKESNEIKHIQTLLAMCVDGLLVSITEETNDGKIFQVSKDRDVPIVFFDRIKEDKNFSHVVSDDLMGVYKAVSYIIKSGYKNLAFLGGMKSTNIGENRIKGFKKAINEYKIKKSEVIIVEGGYEEIDGYKGMQQLLEIKNKLPEVIFCVTYPVAVGVMRAVEKLNISIPKDLNIMSFGGSTYNHFMKPSLSYVKQPIKEIAERATAKLVDHIKDNKASIEHIKIPTEIIIRDTCIKR